jgi:gluconolactonase
VSADGKTFFLSGSNENFLWAFDIGGDGPLSNKRPFANLIPPEFPHDKDRRRGTGDGLALDREGNVWAATNFGIAIFDRTGDFLGNIWLPYSPSHCAFGGKDISTLYVTCRERIYALKTAVKGYEYPIRR